MSVVEKLAIVKAHICEYEHKFNRAAGEVQLIAVSKRATVELIEQAYAAGQRHFAESYTQQAASKIGALQGIDICWHFIGRLQSNKLKEIANSFSWVHGLCQLTHAKRLNEFRSRLGTPLNVCLQVNVSAEPTKAGITPVEVLGFAKKLVQYKHLSVRGLMTILPVDVDFLWQCKQFKILAESHQHLIDSGFRVDTLSMGMSQDYKAAIKQGATMVRIGTAIFS